MSDKQETTKKSESPGTEISRRGLLDYLVGGSATAMFFSLMYPAGRFLVPPKQAKAKSAETKAGTEAEIPVGTGKKIEMNGQPVLVVHAPDGYHALSAICTHLGCIVDWHDDKGQIVCPCHTAAFDLQGNIVSGPPPSPLQVFKVKVRDGEIYVTES